MSKSNKPNPGVNRQQKRSEARRPPRQTASKPLWLRILIVAMLFVMLIGFFIVPLLR